jgi:BirA family biotin operon repressor/biotin-[acetyl-CoA-carboxylase] ligase
MDVIRNYPPNTVIIADEQIAGRGKQDRKWFSERSNNLYMSLSIEATNDRVNYSNYSFLISIAMIRAIEELVKKPPILKTKWPNDILVNNKKVGGILLEMDWQKHLLVIGIGLNLNRHPNRSETTLFEPSDLSSEGYILSRQDIIDQFLKYFGTYSQILEEQGFEPIRNIWLGYAYNLGKEITVKVNSLITNGIFENMDQDGSLVLVTENGKVYIKSADIF